MTVMVPRLPDDAPFTPEERLWIDGYLAGLFAPVDGSAAPPAAAAAPVQEEDFPWHDATLSLDDRLKLADGQPRVRRMMAAMGQLDCGQCGYLCKTYAEAIDSGAEKSLSRCVPGGKDTARMLKELAADTAAAPPAAVAKPAAPAAPAAVPSSTPPLKAPQAQAVFEAARRLTDESSEKDTRHVVLRLDGTGLRYDVGDACAIFAANCPELVAAVIERLGGNAGDEVDCPDGTRRSLADALTYTCEIARPSDNAVEVLASRATGPGESDRLQALAEGYPGAEPADADLLDLLEAFPSARPPIQELISALSPLQPRLYSISSSLKAVSEQVHLTVDTVRWERRKRVRKGVASTFLAERVAAGSPVPVSIQPAHNFKLAAADAPIIMIGPGTGVAPFRAFLQERRETGARGRNWLFFGAQRRAREAGAELWAWLQEGAHLYVCGDAQRMARDVDTALTFLIAKHGGMEMSAAKAYLGAMTREGRYQRDVY